MTQIRMRKTHNQSGGFTLIEMMVTVAIIAILASIALPAYNDYVTRSKITEATTGLADARVRMEQYFQDNRRYVTVAGGTTCGATIPSTKNFSLACTGTDTTFTVTATGTAGMSTFSYDVNQANARTTTITSGGPWPARSGATCWVLKRDGSC